jgi:integral membrane protein (TIGR01906 family)
MTYSKEKKNMKTLYQIFSWLITLLIPIALVFLGLRLLLEPVFLQIEYYTPRFPSDSYGFSLQDRLHWSQIARQYLVNDADIDFLGGLNFPDGSPLYNSRELGHMQDVKNVVQPVLKIGYSVWFVVLGLGIWAQWGSWWQAYRRGLWRGGWLTVTLVIAIAVFAATSFWQFFTEFHSLFFEGDSWLFFYSDTLIRLFPIRFWQDAFLAVGVIALAGGLALGLGLRTNKK